MTTRIDMLNRALLRLGADPVHDEQDPGAEVHLAVYDGVIEHVSALPFTCLKSTRRLPRLEGPKPHGFLYRFQMPAERIAAPRGIFRDADCRQRTTAFEIEEDCVLSDLPDLWGQFILANNPGRWPGDLREAFTVALMAELALSVREDRTLHDRLVQKAFGTPSEDGMGGLIGKALTADNQAEPSTIVGQGVNPLIDVRF